MSRRARMCIGGRFEGMRVGLHTRQPVPPMWQTAQEPEQLNQRMQATQELKDELQRQSQPAFAC